MQCRKQKVLDLKCDTFGFLVCFCDQEYLGEVVDVKKEKKKLQTIFILIA